MVDPTQEDHMNATKNQHEWGKYLKFFTEQNVGRPTRIGVFEPAGGAADDYWIECGLPLVGLDLDTSKERPVVQIIVGTLTHEVPNAVKLNWHLTISGDEDGLDVLDDGGRLTVLRFETHRA